MSRYDMILFDLDGTLTDPGLGITSSVAHALRKAGITPPPLPELYPFIGPPLVDSFVKYYGMTEDEGRTAVTWFREYFRDRGIFENEVYEGIDAMLSHLRAAGKTLVLATSKPEEFAKRILDHFSLSAYFTCVTGASMDESLSRKSDVIALALRRCPPADLSRTVMVGDRLHDIEGAKQNGLPSIGVLYGYGSREELEDAGADEIAATVAELEQLLLH